MTKKEKFIKLVEILFDNIDMSEYEEEMKYFEDFKKNKEKKSSLITENGIKILRHMREKEAESEKTAWTAANIGTGVFMNGRSVAGCMRKLVTDGFVDKTKTDVTFYSLTTKGRTINLEEC